MAELTKKDLEAVLDTKFGQYQKSIIEAVDFKFASLEVHMDQRFEALEGRVSKLEESNNRLAILLEDFLKKMTDYKEEFTILKSEVDKIKSFIKEKFGVEIAIQG